MVFVFFGKKTHKIVLKKNNNNNKNKNRLIRLDMAIFFIFHSKKKRHLTNDTIGELGENKKTGMTLGSSPSNFFKTLDPNFGVI